MSAAVGNGSRPGYAALVALMRTVYVIVYIDECVIRTQVGTLPLIHAQERVKKKCLYYNYYNYLNYIYFYVYQFKHEIVSMGHNYEGYTN